MNKEIIELAKKLEAAAKECQDVGPMKDYLDKIVMVTRLTSTLVFKTGMLAAKPNKTYKRDGFGRFAKTK